MKLEGVRGPAPPASRAYWFVLAPLALIAIAADVLAVAAIRPAHRAPAQAVDPPTPVTLIQAPRHTQPDVADYNTILTERRGLSGVARTLLVKIRMCERSTADPYGAGLTALNSCLSVPVRQNILRARLEPVMFVGVLRDMQPGACAQLAAGLLQGITQLGEASTAWSEDVQTPGNAPGRQEYGDVRDLRQIAGQLIRVAGSGGWHSACRPRPYDAAEHGGSATTSRPRDPRLMTRLAF